MPKRKWKSLDIDIWTKIVEVPAQVSKNKPREKPRALKPISISDSDTNWRSDLKPIKNEINGENKIYKAEVKKPISKADSDMDWRKK